ncbi:bifunctional diaminohydroxyphosphoribosylaminopyrimidine deaminase/5-amino-6-(5-phosphoribosylamino)uracil reductase RibD [candidate division KSB1 bacterium]|nr:bifunctional diaminohydroxyphosphoribosylaminopyrimidine deaminase/5-amino-6-(5-phosphoribosylamino)uracil reductase RibD [candidate division KSB1 bacterium]
MDNAQNRDEHYMLRALELAERGRGMVSPNPMVGAVIVKDDRIIAEGYHQKYGEAHAEVNALARAGDEAAGATLYVTLEPCAHEGKTGPCAQRISEAKIARVVGAMTDPNPLVNGKGYQLLRTKGIEVQVGVLEDACRALNAGYIKWIVAGRPLVTLKAAQTIDGRIATSSGHSKWITSEESRTEAHRIRSCHDAVLIGVNTVIADDPQLTVRHIKAISPFRLVLDSRLRIPLDAKLLSDHLPQKTTIITTEASSKEKMARIQEKGISVLILPEDERGWVDQKLLWQTLAEHGITSVLLEGGSALHTECLKNRVVDRVVIFIAPKIIGSGIDLVGDLNIRNINSAIKLEDISIKQLNNDLMIQANLRYSA